MARCRSKSRRSRQQHPKPFHEKAIQVKADVAAFLKIIASVWLHDSTPTHGRRQPAAAPTQVCVCMGPLSLISGRGPERPGDVKGAPMWARRSEPLTARTVLESETRGQGGFPESHPRPPPNASLTTVSPASFDPSWIFDFVSPPVRPATPFRLASIRTP